MLVLALACVSTDGSGPFLALAPTAQPTVFTVGPTDAVAVRIDRGGVRTEVATTPGPDGATATLVLPAGDRFVLQGIDAAGDASDAVEVETPDAPDVLAEVETRGDGALDGFVLLTQLLPGSAAVSVVNHAGEYVWWDLYEGEQAFAYSAALRLDGSGVDWLLSDPVGQRTPLRSVSLAGEVTEIDADRTRHDLVPLPGGGWASLADDTRLVDGVEVAGSTIVEIDRAGRLTEVWNAWDQLEFDASSVVTSGTQTWWTHANGLSYDAATDTYAATLLVRESVVLVRRSDGVQLAELGGPDPTVRNDTGIHRLHGPALSGSTLDVFDNGAFGEEGVGFARGVETRFDLAAGVWTETWSYGEELELEVGNFGNVAPEPDGGRMVAWGTGGRVDSIGPDGALRWGLDAILGAPFGYCRPVGRLGSMTR